MRKSMDLRPPFQLKKCSRRGSRLLEPEDRISSLPEDVLLFILSFLTFKEVAMTSILSRQWLKFWLHNPVLNFHHAIISYVPDINKKECRQYVNWVNRVVQLHKGHSLKEFKIFCDLDKRNRKDIDSWLKYALARKVQNLELNLLCQGRFPHDFDENYVFPKRLLHLSHKKANSVSGGTVSRFPTMLDFKSLKSLSLKRVDVTSEAIHFFLLNCPYLERLEVAGTSKLVNLVISDPTLVLKYLHIKDCYDLEVLSISNFNLVSLIITAVGDLTLTDLPMLVELSITGASGKFRRCFSQASSCHSQLEALTLRVSKLEDIIQLSNLCQMTKLKQLCIQVGSSKGDGSLNKIFSFINSCPHLMKFVFMMRWYDIERTSRALCKSEKCSSLKCLEVFEFIGYYGRVNDNELVMHVVENADCLKKVIIDPRNLLTIGPSTCPEDEEVRSVALHQFEGLRDSIPPHVDLVIR